MKIEIKSIFGEVLFEGDFKSLSDAVVAAVKSGANLNHANLAGASLNRASLVGANLVGASLNRASLVGANLVGASLNHANLAGASLNRASLNRASLDGASLDGANLDGASLDGASLDGANLDGAKISELQSAQLSIVPSHGEFIGWKKCNGGVIAKLLIPADAKRSNATGRKCRAEFVKVLELSGANESATTNSHGPTTIYKVGEIVKPDKFDENRWDECSHGIHFFITRIEAENYNS